MKRFISVGALLLCASLLATTIGCDKDDRAGQDQSNQGAATADERHDVLYVCNCGPECRCDAVSKRAGDCDCGEALKWTHIVRVEGDEALLCTCGEGCSCSLDSTDHSKCVCGNPLWRVSLKETGIYFCNCGGSCQCNFASDKPGECSCGMALTS